MSEREEVGQGLLDDSADDDHLDYYEEDDDHEEEPPDPWVRPLAVTAGVLVVVILAAVAYGVWYSTRRFNGPRTAAERDLELARLAVRDKPADYQAWITLAYTAGAGRKWSEANGAANNAKRIDPERSTTFLALGDIALARGRRDEALRDYLDGLKLAEKMPKKQKDEMREKGVTYPGVYYQESANALAYSAARLYQERKEVSRALEMLKLAVKYDPQDASAWTMMGDIQREAGKKAEARKDYQEALRFVPDYAPAKKGLEKLDGK